MIESLLSFAKLVAQMRTAQRNYFSPSTPTNEKREWLKKSKALEKRVDELLTALTPETKEQQLHNQRLFS
jgi:hypothetical protein